MLYFDHNATTPLAPEVIDCYAAALRDVPGNASSTHRVGQIARQTLESARLTIARELACSASEIVFTGGGTESNNLAILGIVRDSGAARKHVVTTAIEHPSVLESVRRLEREGVEVSIVSVLEVERNIRPETALVSVMHANNETGSIQSIQEIALQVQARRAAGQKIYFHSDGVQALGKLKVNVSELGVDLYAVSAHKIYGPKGMGALFVRKNTALRGIQFGGRHERERRAGTENVPGAAAFACAVELLPRYPISEVALLRDRFEKQLLSSLTDVKVNAVDVPRLPNTSNVFFSGISGEMLLIALDTAGFAVSTGSACSSGSIEPSHVLLALGQSATEARSSVRFSFGRYNTEEDVDRLAATVIATVERIRKTKGARRTQLVAQ